MMLRSLMSLLDLSVVFKSIHELMYLLIQMLRKKVGATGSMFWFAGYILQA